jgi:hypothetical protein
MLSPGSIFISTAPSTKRRGTMRYRNWRPLLLVGVAFACLSSTLACTIKNVSPGTLEVPTQKYAVVAVGTITATDKLWEPLVPHFRRGFVTRLGELRTFDAVLDPAPSPLPAATVLISGQIVEVEKGSAAKRLWIGMGAGKSLVSGNFEARDDANRVLGMFSASESYLGGIGIGGAGLVDMEDLMQRFGKSVAERLVRWARGEKITD